MSSSVAGPLGRPATSVPAGAGPGEGRRQRWWRTGAVPVRAADLWFAGTALPAAAAVLGIPFADLLELAEQLGLPDRPAQACAPLPLALLTVWRARHVERLLTDAPAPDPASVPVRHRRPVPRPRRAPRPVVAGTAGGVDSLGGPVEPDEVSTLLERTAVALQLPPGAGAVGSSRTDGADREDWLARQVGLALLEHPELADRLPALDQRLGLARGRSAELLDELCRRAAALA